MAVAAGTKSETLERLAPVLKGAKVLPQVRITYGDWSRDRAAALTVLNAQAWAKAPLIARSSAGREDQDGQSNAGRFTSVPNLSGDAAVAAR